MRTKQVLIALLMCAALLVADLLVLHRLVREPSPGGWTALGLFVIMQLTLPAYAAYKPDKVFQCERNRHVR